MSTPFPGLGIARTSNVIAIAKTASEKKINRSSAAAPISGASMPAS